MFDFAYKSNLKNLRIYEDALRRERRSNARHWGFFIAVFAGVAGVVAAGVLAVLALIRTIGRLL